MIFNKKKNIIASQDIRSLLSYRIEKLRADIEHKRESVKHMCLLHNSYKKLALYCFKNLDIPPSHKAYICAHLMGKDFDSKKFDRDCALKFIDSGGHIDMYGQNLDLPLKALEALVDYNQAKLSYFQMSHILDYVFEFYELKVSYS